jgi:hypothetical protein
MRLRSVLGRTLPLFFLDCVVWGADHADRWQMLKEHNPFEAYTPPAPPVVPAPPQLELRGVMVEGRTTWFNVYNAETKESAWVQQGDRLANFAVKEYDANREALMLDYQQRLVSVALKQSKTPLFIGSAKHQAAVASRTLPGARRDAGFAASSMPIGEDQRLEQIAQQIQRRREARRKMGSG